MFRVMGSDIETYGHIEQRFLGQKLTIVKANQESESANKNLTLALVPWLA